MSNDADGRLRLWLRSFRPAATSVTSAVILGRPPPACLENPASALPAENGRRHVPIVDGKRQLVGTVAQSDVVAALYRTSLAG